MKKLLLILLMLPLTLIAKETDFLCSYELLELNGFDDNVQKKLEVTYIYNDEPDEDGETFLSGDNQLSCQETPDSIYCGHNTQISSKRSMPPTFGMKLSDDGKRLSMITNTVEINRLNLTSSYYLMKDSYKADVFSRVKNYSNQAAYSKAVEHKVDDAFYIGSCSVIKKEDLKF